VVGTDSAEEPIMLQAEPVIPLLWDAKGLGE
jgi:hypothetical protein